MGFYQRHVLPHLITFAMSNKDLVAYRERVVAAALGRVLEVGIGSGANVPFYRDGVEKIIGVDPSAELLVMASRQREKAGRPLHLVQASAEDIPLDSKSADTVVMTLCSVPDPGRALAEIRRVLKPSGQLLFVEHGIAPDAGVARWQDRLTPFWKLIAGGCHLNRDVSKLLKEAGFAVSDISTGYMRGPRVATFMYEGSARPS